METQNNLLENDYKVYIAVNEDRLEDGTILPRSIKWEDGITYEIDRIIEWRRAASTKAGGTGLRYQVRIGGKITFMWLEEDKWFVERRHKRMR